MPIKRHISRRDFLKTSLIAGGAGVAGLSGLGNIARTQAATIARAQATTTIRFDWWEERFLDTMNGFIDQFVEMHPGTQVDLQIIPWSAYWDQLPIAIAGGEAPDVFFLVSGQVQNFARLGGLLDLTPFLTEEKRDSFRPAQLGLVTYNENIISLPFTATMLTTYTNLDTFRNAGVDLPTSVEEAWTWEEFRGVLRALKEGNPELVYAYIDAGRDFWWLPWFYSNGARLINDTLDGSAFNTVEAEETLAFLAELTQEELIAPPGESPELFTFGAVAINSGGHWGIANLLGDIGGDFELGATYFPQRYEPGLALGGDYLAAYSEGRNTETAAAFLDFLTSELVLDEYIGSNNYLSPRVDVTPEFATGQDIMDLVVEQADAMSSELLTLHRGLPQYELINQIFTAEYELAVLGSKSPQDAVQAISDAIDEALSD
jgi:multiple sugar transport system substrate-binding protein